MIAATSPTAYAFVEPNYKKPEPQPTTPKTEPVKPSPTHDVGGAANSESYHSNPKPPPKPTPTPKPTPKPSILKKLPHHLKPNIPGILLEAGIDAGLMAADYLLDPANNSPQQKPPEDAEDNAQSFNTPQSGSTGQNSESNSGNLEYWIAVARHENLSEADQKQKFNSLSGVKAYIKNVYLPSIKRVHVRGRDGLFYEKTRYASQDTIIYTLSVAAQGCEHKRPGACSVFYQVFEIGVYQVGKNEITEYDEGYTPYPKLNPKKATEPKPKTDTDTATETKTDTEAKPGTKTDTDTKPGANTKPDTKKDKDTKDDTKDDTKKDKKPDDDGFKLPGFCEWAKFICNDDIEPKDGKVTVEDTTLPMQSVDLRFSKSCPSSHSFPLKFGNSTTSFVLSYEYICQIAISLGTLIKILSTITAAYILAGIRS